MDKPWINHEVKKQIRKRNRLYKRFKHSRTHVHQNEWKHAARETNYLMAKAKSEHTEQI